MLFLLVLEERSFNDVVRHLVVEERSFNDVTRLLDWESFIMVSFVKLLLIALPTQLMSHCRHFFLILPQ
jgi:hypothetical protein